jgi:dTDP-4-amino-4,6-dideoxygalactose transaminase
VTASAAVDVIPVIRPVLGAEEASAAAEAVASGWVAQGPRVAAFEAAMAARAGAKAGVALSSCTAALHLALMLHDVGPGDEVIVPSLSFIATANAVRYVGATPVFADVDVATLDLTPSAIESRVSSRTRALILVHQGGVPADIEAIHRFCEPRGIAVVEDAACAIGSTYRGRPIGGGSELVAYSFHPRKLLTTGEGGMLLCSRDDFADRARRLREHGMSVSAMERHAARDVVIEEYAETGFNYRMTDIQAAIGLVQLQRLDGIIARRRMLAERYQELLSNLPGLATVTDPPWGATNFQSFWVLPPQGAPVERDLVLQRLADEGIQARRGIMAAHLEPAYAGAAGAAPGLLPVTERVARTSLILPLFHDMTESQQDRVVETYARAAEVSRW